MVKEIVETMRGCQTDAKHKSEGSLILSYDWSVIASAWTLIGLRSLVSLDHKELLLHTLRRLGQGRGQLRHDPRYKLES